MVNGKEPERLAAATPIEIKEIPNNFGITSPDDGTKAPDTLVCQGVARAKAQVRVTVEYEHGGGGHTKQIGDPFIVTADANGLWTSKDHPVNMKEDLPGGKIIYLITVEQLDKDGNPEAKRKVTIKLTRADREH